MGAKPGAEDAIAAVERSMAGESDGVLITPSLHPTVPQDLFPSLASSVIHRLHRLHPWRSVTWMSDKQYLMAVGSDDAGVHLKDYIKARLHEDPRVREVRDFGVADTDDKTAYPIVCIRVAEAVARGEIDRAVLLVPPAWVRRSRPTRCAAFGLSWRWTLFHRAVDPLQQLPDPVLGRTGGRA
jgi:ribose/galactose isomerase